MVGFLFRLASRRRLGLLERLCLVGLMGLALAKCSGSASTTQGQNLIHVETSPFSVAVENKVGMPLIDVEVKIVPVSGVTQFTKFAGRIENGEKRELELNTFMDTGGTPFSLRLVTPKTVRVTGKDLSNKVIEVSVPWK